MSKSFITFNLLILSFMALSQEDNPLKELAQLFNSETTPVYRIDFIVLKHLEIEEKDKEEMWPILKNFEFNDHLIELSPNPELLVEVPLLSANVTKELDNLNYQIVLK